MLSLSWLQVVIAGDSSRLKNIEMACFDACFHEKNVANRGIFAMIVA